MTSKTLNAAIVATCMLAGGLAGPAEATPWARAHPRQAQVLARTHHQIARINEERREGDLTRGEARALRASDRAIAHDTLATAHAQGGHLTRAQQHNLNAQLNGESHVIGH